VGAFANWVAGWLPYCVSAPLADISTMDAPNATAAIFRLGSRAHERRPVRRLYRAVQNATNDTTSRNPEAPEVTSAIRATSAPTPSPIQVVGGTADQGDGAGGRGGPALGRGGGGADI